MSAASRILFVGLGSPHGDDRIGWQVAEELLPHVAGISDISVRKAMIPLDLIDWLEGVDQLHICDACCSGEPTGSLLRLASSPSDGNPSRLHTMEHLRSAGTHDLGLAAVLDLASRLVRLPETVVIHAVAARRFEAGAAMTEELTDAVPSIARNILEELSDARNVARAVAAASG